MSTMMSITINTPSPALDHKNSEVRYIAQAVEAALTELGRGSGTVTSGTAAGAGSWTYTPSASLP
jgi:hypothetical protein